MLESQYDNQQEDKKKTNTWNMEKLPWERSGNLCKNNNPGEERLPC